MSDKYDWSSAKELNLNDNDIKSADYLKTDLGYFFIQTAKDTGAYVSSSPNAVYLSLYEDKSDIDNLKHPISCKYIDLPKELNNFDSAKNIVENTLNYYSNNKNLNINDIKEYINIETKKTNEIGIAIKTGYVQGVCECVAAIGDNHELGKKLLTEMKVDKDMAQKFANPETFKVLEQGIFAQKQEQTLEQTQTYTR